MGQYRAIEPRKSLVVRRAPAISLRVTLRTGMELNRSGASAQLFARATCGRKRIALGANQATR
jgi:hypothetical protein